MPGGKGEAVAVAGSEQPVLAALAAAPDRADGVDHVARRQAEARGDLRLSRLAAAKLSASLGELRTCGTVDGAADATAGASMVLAALTMASTSSLVMSPSTISMRSGMDLLETPNAVGIKPDGSNDAECQ